jgi:hypothetical protein
MADPENVRTYDVTPDKCCSPGGKNPRLTTTLGARGILPCRHCDAKLHLPVGTIEVFKVGYTLTQTHTFGFAPPTPAGILPSPPSYQPRILFAFPITMASASSIKNGMRKENGTNEFLIPNVKRTESQKNTEVQSRE